MKKSNKFSPEVREREVGMVQEQRWEYPSLWAAIASIAPKIDCVPQTPTPKLTQARETVSPQPKPNGSRTWSARSKNCAKPTRY
jgi:transposase-like protein